jgi:predicted kinase
MTTTTTNQPTLILTAGLPGAGKSTYLKTSGINLPVVDPDEEKKSHPDYDPKQPFLIHDWSKRKARQKHVEYLAAGVDFIVDGTGTNARKYAQYIREARELGYRVELHYVRVSVETSLMRNAKRERNVPVSVIMEKAAVIEETTAMIGSVCDEFVIVDND